MEFRLNSKHLYALGWLVAGILVLALYASFSVNLPARYNSPDEAANAFFATRLAQNRWLPLYEPLNQLAGRSLIHPRSTIVYNQQIMPASFLGWPLLAGSIGRLAGSGALPYITPLLALLGLGFLYLITKELLNQRAAIITTLLTALQPAFWYYHSRSFFHNAVFVDLLLVAVWLGLKIIKTNKCGWYLLLGLVSGLALSVRTAEIFWFIVVGLWWLIYWRRQVSFKNLWLISLGLIIGLAPIFISNYFLYGFPLSFGYRPELLWSQDMNRTASLFSELILPFGFHPRLIFNTTVNYLGLLMWWWFWPVLAAAIYLAVTWRSLSREFKGLIISTVIISLWLAIVYGSWQFNDNPDPAAVTIGTSYVRYFMPLYILWLIPVGYFLAQLSKLKWGRYLTWFVVGIYLVLSTSLVWFDYQEGLGAVRGNLERFATASRAVQTLTPSGSVIVSGKTDKFFWPERAVIYELKDAADYLAVTKLLSSAIPVYAFRATLQPDSLANFNNKISPFGLTLVPASYTWEDFSLYKYELKVNLYLGLYK
ncbi:MAG: glycosyltransferase family 39 protein [Candidatus Kerfeldbacteria bacterium]|nr:glycosyltransferase family 39 protein [Candidatus Kerfeldbacteria bacterium]